VNIFSVSHAMVEIEERATHFGLHENQVILFYMWLADDRFPGHTFDDAFISKILAEMETLVKEFDQWAHKEALEALEGTSNMPEWW
jgi:hypothetical protein